MIGASSYRKHFAYFITLALSLVLSPNSWAKDVVLVISNNDPAENYKHGDDNRFAEALLAMRSRVLDLASEIKEINVSKLENVQQVLESQIDRNDRVSGIILISHGIPGKFILSKKARYSASETSRILADALRARQVASLIPIYFYSCSLGSKKLFSDFSKSFYVSFENQLAKRKDRFQFLLLTHPHSAAHTFTFLKPIPGGSFGRWILKWRIFSITPDFFSTGLGIPAGAATMVMLDVIGHSMMGGKPSAIETLAVGITSFVALSYNALIASNDIRTVRRTLDGRLVSQYGIARDVVRSAFCEKALTETSGTDVTP